MAAPNKIANAAQNATLDANGNLIAKPDVGQLATAAGQSASPATPGGVSGIGGTPDQAKMAGTPASATGEHSTAGAVAAGTPQPGAAPKTLAQASRPGNGDQKPQISQQDAQAAQRTRDLTAQYGHVGMGVAALISAEAKRGTAATAGYIVPDAGTLEANAGYAALTPDKKAQLQNVLTTLATSPNDPGAIAAAQQILGNGITPQDVVGLLKPADAAGTTAADLGKLSMTPDTMQEFGIQPADLASLGITPDQARGMTLQQFQQTVADHLKGSADQVSSLRAKLTDPALDPNSRAQIQAQLQQLGAAGAVDSAKKAVTEAAGIAPGQHISIGGTDYSEDQLLDDTHMSSLISDYLTSPPGSQVRTDLEKQMPELAKFATDNESALTAAASQMKATAGSLGSTQQANQAITSKVQSMSPDLAKAFSAAIPGWDQAAHATGTAKLDTSKSGVLQMMTAEGADPKAFSAASDALGKLAASDPAKLQSILKMKPAEMAAAGISDPAELALFAQGDYEDMTTEDAKKLLASGLVPKPAPGHADPAYASLAYTAAGEGNKGPRGKDYVNAHNTTVYAPDSPEAIAAGKAEQDRQDAENAKLKAAHDKELADAKAKADAAAAKRINFDEKDKDQVGGSDVDTWKTVLDPTNPKKQALTIKDKLKRQREHDADLARLGSGEGSGGGLISDLLS